jgi:hypothetical protein
VPTAESVYNRLMTSKASLQRKLRFDEVKAMTGEPRLEFDQALARVFVSAAVLAYVGWFVGRDGVVTGAGAQAGCFVRLLLLRAQSQFGPKRRVFQRPGGFSVSSSTTRLAPTC